MSRSGFSLILVVGIIAVLIVAGAVGYGIWRASVSQLQTTSISTNQQPPQPTTSQTTSSINNSTATSSTISTTTSGTSTWKTYTNSQYGYKFQYPADWELSTGTNNSSVTVSTSSSGGLNYQVGIGVTPDWRGLTAEGSVNDELAVDSVRYTEDGGIGGYQFDKRFPVSVNGVSGYELYNVFAYDEGVEEITFVQNGYTYEVGFPTADPNGNLLHPEINNPIAHKILSSLKFFSPSSAAQSRKTYDAKDYMKYTGQDLGISFQYYPDIQFISGNSSNICFSRTSASSSSICITTLDNVSSLSADFLKTFQSGKYASYAIVDDSTKINSSTVLIASDIQAGTPHDPIIAVFMKTPSGCAHNAILATLSMNPQTAYQEADFNELLQTVNDYICGG